MIEKQNQNDNLNETKVIELAKSLEAKTLKEVIPNEYLNEKNKGSIGQLIERYVFKIDNNSNKGPDFIELGIELKVCPLIWKKHKQKFEAKERAVLSIINFNDIILESDFTNSSFYKKSRKILFIFYIHDREKPKKDWIIQKSKLWEYDLLPEDIQIQIKNDWNFIVNKVKKGNADIMSEGDTKTLGACRKGQGKGRDLRTQPNSDKKAQQRAFSLKIKYMKNLWEK